MKISKKTKKRPHLQSPIVWGRVDSNHRTDSRTDLQSVAIATMRLPLKFKELFLFFCGGKSTSFFHTPYQSSEFFCNFAASNVKSL